MCFITRSSLKIRSSRKFAQFDSDLRFHKMRYMYFVLKSMESTIVKEIYMRSEALHGLRYQPFIGDGDSSSYNQVVKSMPYGPLVHIEKAECTNHITKRMGSGLRKLMKDYKGKLSKDDVLTTSVFSFQCHVGLSAP